MIGMPLITIYVELRVVAERSRMQAGSPQAVYRRPCCAVALRKTAWSEHGMAIVNQTWPHCVNQMGKTQSKPLAARHGRERHGHDTLCMNYPLMFPIAISSFSSHLITLCLLYLDFKYLFLTFGTSEKYGCQNASIISVTYDHIDEAQNCITDFHYIK
jgi:hypothetical protein